MQQFKTRHMWEVIDLMMKLQDCKVSGIDYIPIQNSVRLGRDMHMHLTFDSELNHGLLRLWAISAKEVFLVRC